MQLLPLDTACDTADEKVQRKTCRKTAKGKRDDKWRYFTKNSIHCEKNHNKLMPFVPGVGSPGVCRRGRQGYCGNLDVHDLSRHVYPCAWFARQDGWSRGIDEKTRTIQRTARVIGQRAAHRNTWSARRRASCGKKTRTRRRQHETAVRDAASW